MIVKTFYKNKFDIHKFNYFFDFISPIYAFTTENIKDYFSLLDFKNKYVATIIGSGDHIINAVTHGANHITGFDINILSLAFSELKIYALSVMSYNDFLNFFMIQDQNNNKNLNVLDYRTYKNKIYNLLSPCTRKIFNILYKLFNYSGYKLRNSYIFNNKYDNNELKINSNTYLKNEKKYLFTQKNIQNVNVQLFENDINNFYLENIKYDILLTSNISDYAYNIFYEENYLEKFFLMLFNKYKNKCQTIISAYIYDVGEKNIYRSQVDNCSIRKNIFLKNNIIYHEKIFNSVMKDKYDAIIIF